MGGQQMTAQAGSSLNDPDRICYASPEARTMKAAAGQHRPLRYGRWRQDVYRRCLRRRLCADHDRALFQRRALLDVTQN